MAARQNQNPDKQNLKTPRGTLKWPKLNEPDHGTEKFPCKNPAGEYKTKLVLDRNDPGVEAFLDKIDKAMERAEELASEKFKDLPLKTRKALEAKGGITADLPYQEIYDEDTEQPTGQVEILFKMQAGGVRKKDGKKWSQTPGLFDSKKQPLSRKIVIWGGSTAVVNFDLEPYFIEGTGKFGVSKRLQAVQVLQLVSAGGSKSASSYGFDEEEGFDSSEYADAEVDTDDTADVSDDDDVDADANF